MGRVVSKISFTMRVLCFLPLLIALASSKAIRDEKQGSWETTTTTTGFPWYGSSSGSGSFPWYPTTTTTGFPWYGSSSGSGSFPLYQTTTGMPRSGSFSGYDYYGSGSYSGYDYSGYDYNGSGSFSGYDYYGSGSFSGYDYYG